MKLVDRREIVRPQMLDVLPGLLQRRKDDVPEISTGVVSFDGILWQFFLLGAGTAGTAVVADTTLK